MAARAHPDGDRDVGEVFGVADVRIVPHEDGPGGNAIGLGNHPAHAGAGVADGAPFAGPLHDFPVLGIGLVLGTLEIRHPLPARLGAPEGCPVHLHVEPFGLEKALFHGHEVVETHPLGGDFQAYRAIRHVVRSFACAGIEGYRTFSSMANRGQPGARRRYSGTTSRVSIVRESQTTMRSANLRAPSTSTMRSR